jgi:SNF2 family DNA or RNA helicase
MIRNKNTRACKAAWDLNSIYRWCLTGTPVMNTLGDLYPILHFLNISPQADWKEFSAHIMKPEKKRPTLAVKRMQVNSIIRQQYELTTDILGDPENLLYPKK